MISLKRLSLYFGVFTVLTSLVFSNAAFAHVVVKPAQVPVDSFQTFTIGVPNEKDLSTISLKIVIPSGLQYVAPTIKPGWSIDLEKQGGGEDAVVKSITWTGGEIASGFRDDFTFSGKVPEKTANLEWKAYQTYSDGTVVSWDQPDTGKESDNPNVGPLSVTEVTAEEPAATASHHKDSSSTTALYASIVALAISLGSLVLTARK